MRRTAAASLWMASWLLACGGPNGPAARTGEQWGASAVDLFEQMAAAVDTGDDVDAARHFALGGTLDLRAWGFSVATTPEEVVQALDYLYFMDPAYRSGARVEVDHVFLGADGAVALWYADSYDGYEPIALLYTVTGDAGSTVRGYARPVLSRPTDHAVVDLFDRYLALRAGGRIDESSVDAVYSPQALVHDDLHGSTFAGRHEIDQFLDREPVLQRGPLPAVYPYITLDRTEAIAIVQLPGQCPRLQARRWVVEDGLIVGETIYTHIGSAARCGDVAVSGWWDDFELAPALDGVVSDQLDRGTSTVDLVNAKGGHRGFARWLFERYAAAGLDLPVIDAIWFPPSPECESRGGQAREADVRYDGGYTVTICFEPHELRTDETTEGWDPVAVSYGLHELGHVWLFEHLTDTDRAAFTELLGLPVWRSAEVRWDQQAMEHAATTIGWGVAGDELARYMIPPAPECRDLVDRYVVLTGRDPVTTCGEVG